jgi:hypothetical protein
MRAQNSTTAKTVAKISTVSNTTGGKKSVARRSTGRNHSSLPVPVQLSPEAIAYDCAGGAPSDGNGADGT